MAQNNEASKSADKGKGKAAEKEVDETKKTKDGQVNGKKDEEKVGCMSTANLVFAQHLDHVANT